MIKYAVGNFYRVGRRQIFYRERRLLEITVCTLPGARVITCIRAAIPCREPGRQFNPGATSPRPTRCVNLYRRECFAHKNVVVAQSIDKYFCIPDSRYLVPVADAICYCPGNSPRGGQVRTGGRARHSAGGFADESSGVRRGKKR